MKTVEHYICEVCGVEYENKDKCKECESNHKKPVKIVSSKYHPIKVDKTGLPSSVVIEVEDGKQYVYKR